MRGLDLEICPANVTLQGAEIVVAEPGTHGSNLLQDGDRNISASTSQIEKLRLVIIEPDDDIACAVRESLERFHRCGRTLADNVTAAMRFCKTLDEFIKIDLKNYDLVIAASRLPDGTGIDALRYVQSTEPELAVLVTGQISDAAAGLRAIREGAIDFLLTTPADLHMLPLHIEKCIEHQWLRLDNARLQRAVTESFAELALKNQQLQAMIERLEELSRTDELTGLANRRWLGQNLERAWGEASRYGRPLAFLMVDMDGFKELNDLLGHPCGDELLRLTGRVLQANCRQVDLAARYGGDEFCVIMPHTTPEDAVRIAERVLREFRLALRHLPEGAPKVGMSIGISHNQLSNPAGPQQLVQHADEALYEAKARANRSVVIRGGDGMFVPEGLFRDRVGFSE